MLGSAPVSARAACVLGAGLAIALLQPDLVWPLLAASALAGVAFLAVRHPIPASVAWLAFTGTTPEMWLGDLAGADATIIALTKLAGIALVAVCMLRFGARADPANPAFAFAAIFAIGLAHGLHPNLSAAESLRTLAGSAAPYAFAFARLPRRWAQAIIRTTCVLPLLTVLGCVPLAIADIRPLFRELDGLRLAGLSHPAFLGGVALAGIYACLVELFREGRRRDLALLAANTLILVLSGARAPLVAAASVGGCAFLLLRTPSFPWRRRIPVLLCIGTALPLVFILAGRFTAFRLFNLLDNSIDDLSGRDVIWPYFQDAWDASPWLGWGIGAGKVLIDIDDPVAQLLGTTAAHNEYLRLGVEGGWAGIALLAAFMAAWCIRHTARMRRTDQIILRLVFVAFAVHSFTDNTLIASTASVLFTWVCAVFARADADSQRLAGLITAPAANG